jgi:hypothetical protein
VENEEEREGMFQIKTRDTGSSKIVMDLEKSVLVICPLLLVPDG